MKRNDAGDFCVLYVEPEDEREALFETILGQAKPVVIMLAEQARIFQRPDDFAALKHVKRQLDKPIVFVISNSERLMQLAGRQGFPVYLSMDALANALATGHLTRPRTIGRTTSPLTTSPQGYSSLHNSGTLPLSQQSEEASVRKTTPLSASIPEVEHPVQRNKPYNRLAALSTVLAIMILLAGSFAYVVLRYHQLPSEAATATGPTKAAGHIFLLNSEQLSENTSQGINDKVLIDLQNVPHPSPNTAYYAWMLTDKNTGDTKATLLGALQVHNGKVHQIYAGDAQHTNLLVMDSRFLVTEEDANIPPISPSPDYSTWRYYGEISQTPINAADNVKHFSYLDHLRHLLATDPTLDELELPGGLNNWFYRNSGKILEWSRSMREQWEETQDMGLLRRQTIRTLAYLDGLTYAQRDIPPGSPVYLNERLARVGLLDVTGPNQDPPSYIDHIVHHLNGLLQASGSTKDLRKNAAAMITALNDVKLSLDQVRHDAQQIIKMNDDQLRTPDTLTLINDMIDNANHAYVGYTDPLTGEMHQGVVWIHDQMQQLATFEINTYTPGNSSIQMIQDRHVKAFLLMGE